LWSGLYCSLVVDNPEIDILLFYSNLLMGEFERSGMGQKRGVAWAIGDVFTAANFEIATIAALIGYILFEFLRKRF
jgi:hypothetical protein